MKAITAKEKHEWAEQITDVIIKQKLGESHIDEVSGCLFPNGLEIRTLGGLFQVSPDRTNNAKPHFLHGKPWDHNIRLTALALNTRA